MMMAQRTCWRAVRTVRRPDLHLRLEHRCRTRPLQQLVDLNRLPRCNSLTPVHDLAENFMIN